MKPGWVYILKCADESYYVGSTIDLDRRLKEHQTAKDSESYTAQRLPVELMFSQTFNTIQEAFRIEHQIKKWSRKKKEALIAGNIEELHKLAECQNDTHFKNYLKIAPVTSTPLSNREDDNNN